MVAFNNHQATIRLATVYAAKERGPVSTLTHHGGAAPAPSPFFSKDVILVGANARACVGVAGNWRIAAKILAPKYLVRMT
jgi:hypothetical protein